jgi:HEAT repeat protein
VPIVLEFLADPNPVVRREALNAAAALLDPNRPDGRAVEPLAAVLRDARPSPQERLRIVTLLGRTGATRAVPLLVDLARAPDVTLRIAALDALGVLRSAGADDVLIDALGSADTAVRLHAAMALSEAGGVRAREALLAELVGGDEVDRAAVLTALGGVLARAPSEIAVANLVEALDLAAGPERDGIIEALGRARLPSAVLALASLSRAPEPADRQATATLLAAHAADATAAASARFLLLDVDAPVRAQAAWSLGTIGDVSDLPRLETITREPDFDAAANAAAAIGRIAARAQASQPAAGVLCPRVSDARPYVRANALAALALAGARCGDGSPERAVLAEDANEDARAAAALVLLRSPNADDANALDRCARADPSGAVAARCHRRGAVPGSVHSVQVYVVTDGVATPRPGAAYAMLLSDGTIHLGRTDRRGALFDPVAPEGEATLRPSSALAR